MEVTKTFQREENVDVKNLTTFGVSKNATTVVEVKDPLQIKEIFNDSTLPRPFKIIGEGSNLLFIEDFKGTIVKPLFDTTSYSHDRESDTFYVTVSAGEKMDDLIAEVADLKLWGLENLSGIPGNVGAVPVQNVGAYGVEACDVIEKVNVYDTVKDIFVDFKCNEMQFGYRDSIFKHPEFRGRYVVLSVVFRLTPKYSPVLSYGPLKSLKERVDLTPMMVRDEIIKLRDSKLPKVTEYGSAGSFFINPVVDKDIYLRICQEFSNIDVPHYKISENKIKIPAAWLIDKCGLKGRIFGGAQVWPTQPLVIVNKTGNATAEDIVALNDEIIEKVNEKFGIKLKREVEFVSNESTN